jgi:hypothetical protein
MVYVDSRKQITMRDSIGYGIAGGVAIMLYYPSVFILAGIGVVQITSAFCLKNRERFEKIMFSVFCWLAYFAIIYFVYCYHMFDSGIMSRGTNPYPIGSFDNLAFGADWFTVVFLGKTVGLSPYWVGIYFILAGTLSLLRKDKKTLFAFVLPVLFVFLALIFRKYPMHSRFFVAFLPGVLIIFAHGVWTVMQCKKKSLRVLSAVLLGVLIFNPLKIAAGSLFNSHALEETKPLMRNLEEHRQSGDVLFMNDSARYVYVYYLVSHRLTDGINPIVKTADYFSKDEKGRNLYVQGERYDFDDHGAYQDVRANEDLFLIAEDTPKPFGNGKRTWMFFSHILPEAEEFILQLLDRSGVRLKEFKQKGSSLYLYDLSG